MSFETCIENVEIKHKPISWTKPNPFGDINLQTINSLSFHHRYDFDAIALRAMTRESLTALMVEQTVKRANELWDACNNPNKVHF